MEQAAVRASGGNGGGAGLLTVMEAAYELRIGYAATLAAIRRGDLPARKLGRGYRIRRAALDVALTPLAPPSCGPLSRGVVGR